MYKVTITNKEKNLTWSSTFKDKDEAKIWTKEQLRKPNRALHEVDINVEKLEDEVMLKKIKKAEKEVNRLLLETTWSMLPDARLSQEGRRLYKEYRDYLRDFFDLYNRKQILSLEVLEFEDWRKDPPVYKLEKKVIL
jgi:hypothetical protein